MRIWNIISVIILDQITKYMIIHNLKLHQAIPITGFFNITYIKNTGVVFGIMSNMKQSIPPILFVVINIIAIIILILWLLKPDNNIWMNMGISLIIGGAFGNLMDRLVYGGVIDFLDFHIGKCHWPAFNIADTAITIGTILLGIGLFFKDKYAPKSI